MTKFTSIINQSLITRSNPDAKRYLAQFSDYTSITVRGSSAEEIIIYLNAYLKDDQEHQGEKLPNAGISSLDLSTASAHVTDETLKYVADKFPNLQKIDLSNCAEITDAGIEHLKFMPIREINLFFCNKITDIGISHLKSMPLKDLDISGCKKITDAGLINIRGKPLTGLYLSLCSDKITEAGIKSLIIGMPLKYFLPPDNNQESAQRILSYLNKEEAKEELERKKDNDITPSNSVNSPEHIKLSEEQFYKKLEITERELGINYKELERKKAKPDVDKCIIC